MTHDTVIEIKKALRAAMNGVLSAKMREAGMPYKLVFGRLEVYNSRGTMIGYYKHNSVLGRWEWYDN